MDEDKPVTVADVDLADAALVVIVRQDGAAYMIPGLSPDGCAFMSQPQALVLLQELVDMQRRKLAAGAS